MELTAIRSLTLDPSNARKHSSKNLESIKGSLAKFGQQKPIVVSKDNIVIAGNGTLEAAKALGWSEIGVIRSKLTGTEAIAYAVADNRTGELAEWDDDVLSKTLAALKEENFDLNSIGFDDDDLAKWLKNADVAEPGCDEDEIPEEVETRSKPGDIWLLGDHRVMCGDSTNIHNIGLLIGGAVIEAVYTDPPYGINESGDRSSRGGKAKARIYTDFKDDSTQYAIDAFNICESFNIKEMVWWGANYYCHSLPLSNNWLVWDKRVEEKQTDNNSDCELAWVKSKTNSVRIFRHLWKGMCKDSENGQARIHPTQKPIALAEWCLNRFEKSGKVLDLFLGSGSTLIACEKTGRKCFGMEIDPKYVDVILTRWEKYTGKTAALTAGI